MKTDIYGYTYDELCRKLSDLGEKVSRADIIFPAVYGELVTSFNALPLKRETLDRLNDAFFFGEPECLKISTSETADKYLFRLSDGSAVESVMMKHDFGCNVCVSTQVGCDMGCAFCMSGRLKHQRDLTVSELVGQAVAVRRLSGCKISGISIMGIGEPMLNLRNVLSFIGIMTYPKGFDIGIKHITISTCGIVPGIYELAESRYPVNLAISLHAPTDELRKRIMPVTKRYPLAEVMTAARYYSEQLNRRITLEYVMLDGVNDSPDHASRLADLVDGINAYINIIRYNPTSDSGFECSPHERIMEFYDILKKRGVGVTMRRSLGDSINAACGQLSACSGDLNKT